MKRKKEVLGHGCVFKGSSTCGRRGAAKPCPSSLCLCPRKAFHPAVQMAASRLSPAALLPRVWLPNCRRLLEAARLTGQAQPKRESSNLPLFCRNVLRVRNHQGSDRRKPNIWKCREAERGRSSEWTTPLTLQVYAMWTP